MLGKQLRLLFLFLFCLQVHGQTTDLSIAIEAQNLSGNAISQVDIYEDFQYVITVLNSGNSVDNATISVTFDTDLTILSYNSQNSNAGASDVSNINVNTNVLTASIDIMPNNSSVELLVLVTAPTNLGGIAANGTVNPPPGTTDTNTSNNQSIISIDVLDVVLDFSVTHVQIQPTEGTAITAWGETVTYQFTITNNSDIDFPVSSISGVLNLSSPSNNGQPFAEFISLDCIATTNGTSCPGLSGFTGVSTVIQTSSSLFTYGMETEVTSGGSITFEMVYKYSNFSCSQDPMPIAVDSDINILLNTATTISIDSNSVTTDLLLADVCPETDICIETIQTNPDVSVSLDYGQDITFITTVCNNGPSAAAMRFFFQNLSPIFWDISSISCLGTTGPVTCNDFTISDNNQIWTSNDFVLQANTTITIETILQYIEPDCSPNNTDILALIRSATNILDNELIDSDLSNNFFANQLSFPAGEPCEVMEVSDLTVTKTQVNPQLPIGSSIENTTEWGLVTYEITVTNIGEEDGIIELQDYMPVPNTGDVPITGTLTAVECIATTGTANCFTIENTNIGIELDGITEDGTFDAFWQILPEDNWSLPANSSVSFSVTVDWLPECSTDPMIGTNAVSVNYANNIIENDYSNNTAQVNTYFAGCMDLVVQTYPEFTQVDTNQTFNWIVDISNSTTSSNGTDIFFENTVNPVFNIVGSPICTVTSGNATCISSFNVVGNFITGIIPNMEAGSTVSITIPVTAPSYGGAFNNIAEAIPSAANNEELTPETNISINSVQVISPILQKSFTPDAIFEGYESELSFTVFNIATNPTQSNISFTDNLPSGITLSGSPNWTQANGCTATFIGNLGDDFVGVEDLVFPDDVASCTFSVMVTSDISGTYLNNFQNFANSNNIDTSQTSATLNVIIDTSDVDIEIIKTVTPTEAAYGQDVDFTITATNIGTTIATAIEIIDQLPQGYEFVSFTVSAGAFDVNTFIWTIPSLSPSMFESLILTARIVSSTDLTNVAILNSVNEPDRDPSNNEDDASIEISNCLIIPEGISPNGDRKNDVLIIPCIEEYPDNTLKIYNRYGTQIYQSSSYLNTWNGKANMGFPMSSELLPVGTYFYVLDIKAFAKPFVGYVYLNY